MVCRQAVEEKPIKVLKQDSSLILSTQRECQCSHVQNDAKLITDLTLKLQEVSYE